MKAVLITTLFWILVVVGLGVYTKWFNDEWAQHVSSFVYTQDMSGAATQEIVTQEFSGFAILNAKLDDILLRLDAMTTITDTSVGTPTPTPMDPKDMIIRDLESRIQALEATLNQ